MWYRIKNCHMLALLIPGCRPCGHKAKQTWTDAVRNMKYSGIKVVSMPIHSPVVVESKNQTALSSGTIPWHAPEMFKLGAAAGNTLTMSTTPHQVTRSVPLSVDTESRETSEGRKIGTEVSDMTSLTWILCVALHPVQINYHERRLCRFWATQVQF